MTPIDPDSSAFDTDVSHFYFSSKQLVPAKNTDILGKDDRTSEIKVVTEASSVPIRNEIPG